MTDNRANHWTARRKERWRMAKATTKLAGSSSKGAAVAGRPRKDQPKSVQGTPAGMFGARLVDLMEREGVTAKELADAIGKSEDSVWGYIRGTSTPPINLWPQIARKLGLKDARQLLPKIPS